MEKLVFNKTHTWRGKTFNQVYYRLSYCPICGSKKQRCMRMDTNGVPSSYICKYNTSGKPIETAIGTCWIHEIAATNVIDIMQKTVQCPVQVEITPELISFRSKVYYMFRELIKKFQGTYLNDRDLNDLKKRGLVEEQISRMKFFSCPLYNQKVWYEGYSCKIRTAISLELYKRFGDELLKVPGFKKVQSPKGDYITFKLVDGYFIPYTNFCGEIQGLQYRLTVSKYDKKGKPMRYFWYSSEEASSGSPICFYSPATVRRQDIILVTEGAIKGMIASEYLNYKSCSEAGVGNYNNLLASIQDLESITGVKYKIILALDADKYDNPDVLDAERKTISALKQAGNPIAISYWDTKFKGIDDALINGVKINYRLI